MENDPKLNEQEDQILEMLDEQIEPEPEPEPSPTQEIETQGTEEQGDGDNVKEDKSAEVEQEESKDDAEEIKAEDNKDEEESTEEVQEEKKAKPDKEVSKDNKEDKRDEVIASLQSQLEEVASKAMGQRSSTVNLNQEEKSAEQIEEENKKEEQEPNKEKKVVRDLLPFVSDEVYEKALSDPSELNNLLNRVYDSAVSYMTQSIPQLVGQMVNQQTQMKTLVDDFYKENEDLVPMKSYVGFIANELAAEHPDWAYDKLFGQVAKEVRKRVNISNKASSVENKAKSQRPAFAKKPSGRSNVTSKLNDLEQDIVDLM